MDYTKATVWYRASYQNDDGKKVSFRVQDVTPDLHERLIQYYETQFVYDETVFKSLNWWEDQVTMTEYKNLAREALTKGGSVVAIEEDTENGEADNVIGAGLYVILKRGDAAFTGEGPCMRKLIWLVEALKSPPEADPLNRPANAVSHYKTGCGMWVRRDRRRRGVAEAVIRGALAKCRANGVPNFTAFYTGIGGQRAAVKAGLQEVCRISYDSVKDEDGEPMFPRITEKDCVLLGIDLN